MLGAERSDLQRWVSGERKTRRERTLAALTVALLWASALLIGGVLPVHAACLGVVAVVAWCVGLWRKELTLGAPLWGLIALAAFSALQCIVWPGSWLAALDSETAAIWARSQRLLGADPSGALSLDPHATRLEVLKALILASTWVLAAAFRKRWGLRAALTCVFTLALAVFALSALHLLLNAERVYGWYRPLYATLGQPGPLLNPNVRAGLLNLGAFAGLGLMLHRHAAHPRVWLVGLGVAVLAAGSLLTGSRGASLALVLGLLTLGLLCWRDWRREQRAEAWRRQALPAGLAVASALGLVALAMRPELLHELNDASLQKLASWSWGARVVLAHPWFGTGRGALGPELGRLGEPAGGALPVHAENWLLEWLGGWGIGVGGAAIVGLLWLLRPTWDQSGRTLTQVCIWLGLWVVVLQNLVDLGLEVLGLSVPFTFALASLHARRAEARAPRVRWWGWIIAAATAVVSAHVLVTPVQLAHHERHELGRRFAGPVDQAPQISEIAAGLSRHPADAFLMRLGAQVLYNARQPELALAWINASLVQAPHAARTYVLLAEILQRLGRTDQALVSLRAAAQHDAALHPEVAQLAQRWAPHALQRVVPEGPHAGSVLFQLARAARTSEQRLDLLKEARSRAPSQPGMDELEAETHLDAWSSGQAPCAAREPSCLLAAGQALERAEASAAGLTLGLVALRGRWLLAQGSAAQAFAWLLERCPRRANAGPCLTVLLESAAVHSSAALSQAADVYLDAHCYAAAACAEAQRRVAAAFEQRGELLVAYEHLQRATEHDDSGLNWIAAADVALKLGKRQEAEYFLGRAERSLDVQSSDAQLRLQELRLRLGER